MVAAVTFVRARNVVAEPGQLVLQHSTRARVFGIAVIAGIVASAAFGPFVEVAPKDQLLATLVAVSFVVLLAWVAIELVGHKVVLGRDTLVTFSPWAGRRSARWTEIGSVVYSENWQQFEIKTGDGAKLAVSQYLPGLDEFLRRVDGLGLTIRVDPFMKNRSEER